MDGIGTYRYIFLFSLKTYNVAAASRLGWNFDFIRVSSSDWCLVFIPEVWR